MARQRMRVVQLFLEGEDQRRDNQEREDRDRPDRQACTGEDPCRNGVRPYRPAAQSEREGQGQRQAESDQSLFLALAGVEEHHRAEHHDQSAQCWPWVRESPLLKQLVATLPSSRGQAAAAARDRSEARAAVLSRPPDRAAPAPSSPCRRERRSDSVRCRRALHSGRGRPRSTGSPCLAADPEPPPSRWSRAAALRQGVSRRRWSRFDPDSWRTAGARDPKPGGSVPGTPDRRRAGLDRVRKAMSSGSRRLRVASVQRSPGPATEGSPYTRLEQP